MSVKVQFKHWRDAPSVGEVVDYCGKAWLVATVVHGWSLEPCVVHLKRRDAPKKPMVFLHSGTQS